MPASLPSKISMYNETILKSDVLLDIIFAVSFKIEGVCQEILTILFCDWNSQCSLPLNEVRWQGLVNDSCTLNVHGPQHTS